MNINFFGLNLNELKSIKLLGIPTNVFNEGTYTTTD